MFWVVARFSQRLKSTFFEIFSHFADSFGARPSSVATVLQPQHYDTTTLQHCNTTTQHYNTDLFQRIANLAGFYWKIEKFGNFSLTYKSRFPNSHWKLLNWQYSTQNSQKLPNCVFSSKNANFAISGDFCQPIS